MGILLTRDKPVKKQISDTATTYNRGELHSGNGLIFDGVNDYIAAGDLGIDIRTIHVLVNPDSATEKVIDLDGGTHVLEIVSGVVTATGFVSPNIYVDGALGTTIVSGKWSAITITTDTAIDVNSCDIGRVSAIYYSGDMAGLMLFGPVLSVSQIERIFSDSGMPLAPGLVASDLLLWLPMCENNSTVSRALDYSGNGHHLVITGAVPVSALAAPVLQTATNGIRRLYFDGVTNYVTAGSLLEGYTENFTLSIWFYASTFKNKRLFCRRDNSGTHIDLHGHPSTGVLGLYDGTSSSYGTTNIETAGIVNAVMVATSEDVLIYIDGSLEVNTSNALSNYTVTTGIGARASGIAPISGCVFNVTCWDVPLQQSEITQLASGINVTDINNESIIAYYNNDLENGWKDLKNDIYNGVVNGTVTTITALQGVNPGRDFLNFPLALPKGFATFQDAEFVDIPHNSTFDLTSNLTLEAWINPDNFGATQYLICKEDSYLLAITTSGNFGLALYQSSSALFLFSTTTPLTVNKWYYIAATYDGSTRILYVNGEEILRNTAVTGAIDTNTNPVVLAAQNTTPNWLYTGGLDDTRIYNTALDAATILNNYRAGLIQHTN